VTLGLRYAIYTPPWEVNGQQVIPSPNLGDWFETRRSLALAGLPSSQAPRIFFDLGGKANGKPGYYQTSYSDFMPRLAAAWAPHWKDGFLGWLSGDGKLVFRAGYGIVYDRVGSSLVAQFDELGSFGLSTSIDSTFGGCDEGGDPTLTPCPRFNGDIFSVPTSLLPPSPSPTFPSFPPGGFDAGSFAITSALDGNIKTPYAHTFNFTIGRELPGDFAVEASYVGRRGRRLLVQRDLSMPLNLVDAASGMDYFTAATMLTTMIDAGVPISAVQPIPYWENMYPTWGAFGGRGLTNTQEAYRRFDLAYPDFTFALFRMDLACPDPVRGIPCSKFGNFAYFNDQYGALQAWSSIGRSEYHAFQLAVKKNFSKGLSFAFNYTLSKSRDHQSEAEYADDYGGLGTGGVTGFLVNSWDIDTMYGYSDFDMRHQMNANWYWEIPYGKGKRWGSSLPGWANAILGGWQFAGLIRATSGLPATVGNGRFWPTNWNITGNGTCIGGPASCPSGRTTRIPGVGVNFFRDAGTAIDSFRFSYPGETGDRNVIRGDGYFGLDTALGKKFQLPWEGQSIQFRWEVFNLTNTTRFDTGTLNMNLGSPSAFGTYQGVLGPFDGASRVMQFSLRYEF
jgi:hypothetical protein